VQSLVLFMVALLLTLMDKTFYRESLWECYRVRRWVQLVPSVDLTPVLTGAATIGSLSAAASIAIGTTVVAVGSFGVGLLADAGLQAINNNGKVDWGTAAWSGLQAAALNILNVFTAGTAGSLAEISASLTIGLAVNFLTGIIGLAIDLLRNPKYRGQYKYNLYDKGKFYAR